jgi:hypothetical protein
MSALLDEKEARTVGLDVRSYRGVVNRFLRNEDGSDRVTAVAFEKSSDKPVGMATFCKSVLDAERFEPLATCRGIGSLAQGAERKVFFELEYCVRSALARGQCVGDMVLSCGLEKMSQLEYSRRTVVVWLVLAGGFKNSAALRLYLSYRFEMTGLYCGSYMMSLSDLDGGVLTRTVSTLRDKLEAKYLLPVLKSNKTHELSELQDDGPCSQELSQTTQASSQSTTTEAVTQTSDPESEKRPDVSSDSDSESQSVLAGLSTPVRRPQKAVVTPAPAPVVFNDAAALQRIGGMSLIPFVEYLTWSPTLIHSISGNRDETVRNLMQMENTALKFEKNFVLQQRLEMGKQLESYASSVEKNTFDALFDVVERTAPVLSLATLKMIVRIRWYAYKFPFLEQTQMTWKEGMTVRTMITIVFDIPC